MGASGTHIIPFAVVFQVLPGKVCLWRESINFLDWGMINQEELDQLLSSLESDRIEKTLSVSKDNKFGEVICAFSNDLAEYK